AKAARKATTTSRFPRRLKPYRDSSGQAVVPVMPQTRERERAMDFSGTWKRLVRWGRNGEATPADGQGSADLVPTALPVDEREPPVINTLEEKQQLLAHFVRLVARKVSYGLFVAGAGGCGKSKVISETLAAESICPVLLNSHITPLSLFMTLYQFREDK